MHSGITAVFQQYGIAFSGYKCHIIFVGLVIAMVLPAPVAADYLSELEAEAESSAHVLDEDRVDIAPALGAALGKPGPVADGRREFERTLKAEKPNIYTFYSRLSEPHKAQVVDYHMASSGKVLKTVNLILDLYFQKKK